MDALGNPDSLKINLDTGNSWLGGSDPVELARDFKDDIYHIHWKDLPADMEPQRGSMWGTGMGLIPLGTGAIDIAGVYEVLKDARTLNTQHSRSLVTKQCCKATNT